MDRPLFWYGLYKTNGLGPKALLKIARAIEIHKMGEWPPEAQLEELSHLPETTRFFRDRNLEIFREESLMELQGLDELGVEVIYPGINFYPQNLLTYTETLGISPVLFTRGPRAQLQAKSVAVVGSRNADEATLDIASRISSDLAGQGFNIVSGYAKGIDSAAHLGALSADGTTTVVLSHGILKLTVRPPFDDFNWGRDILAVSQFAPQDTWRASSAFARNRLVCALSQALVVIQSGPERDSNGKMSGTFDAAKVAMRMGLPTFVLDHSSFEPQPLGNASLIRAGAIPLDLATPVQSLAQHIANQPPPDPSAPSDQSSSQMSLFHNTRRD